MSKLLSAALLLLQGVFGGEVEDRIKRIEGRWKPAQRMTELHVPGVSIAVVNGGKLEWARAYGATTETLFQAASISKPIAAMAALHLAQNGNFTLDEDVNEKLVSWKIPTNEFMRDDKVTVRRILSHSAGLTVQGFRGYAQGEPVPSLKQILEGEKPANSAPILVDILPGSKWRYSGGGYTIMQQLMIDRMKMPFPQIMNTIVLRKLGMKHSTFEQPLPADLAATAATGHREDGKAIAGKWHTYPEMAAAGLWTTPSDLALFMIELQESIKGASSQVLERSMANEMVKRQFDEFGLGLVLLPGAFKHSGSNEGFRAKLYGTLDSGFGVIVMTNSDAGDKLINEIGGTIEAEYQLKK